MWRRNASKNCERIVRSEVSVEASEIRIVTRSRGEMAIWCHICNKVVPGLRPEIVGLVIGVPVRRVYQLIEAESIHFHEHADGTVLICPSSLTALKDFIR